MGNIRRSLAFSAADSYVSLTMQLAGTFVMSRILSPAETGTFAVAAVFTALASNFRNFGITEFLIQEKQLDNAVIRAALGANILISWLLGAALLVASGFVADFFRSPGVADVMRVQSISFALIPFGAIGMAYFRRELNLKPVFIANVLSSLSSFTVCVTLGLNGFGYMSLAWAGLVGVIVTVSVSMLFRPQGFPRLPSFKGMGRVFHFGKHASGIYLFGQMGKGAPEMIIGRTHGVEPVAYFSRASGLVELFNRLVLNAIWPVVLPYFTRSEHKDGSLREAYLTCVGYLTIISWPILGFLALRSYSAIHVIYGPQWASSVALAPILCVAASVQVVYHLTGESLVAKGMVATSNYLQIGIQSLQVVGLLAVIPFGLPGACWGLLASSVAGAALNHHALTRSIKLRFIDVIKTTWPNLRITVISLTPAALLTWAFPVEQGHHLLVSLVSGILMVGLWLECMRRARHPLWNEGLKLVKKRKKAGLASVGAEEPPQ